MSGESCRGPTSTGPSPVVPACKPTSSAASVVSTTCPSSDQRASSVRVHPVVIVFEVLLVISSLLLILLGLLHKGHGVGVVRVRRRARAPAQDQQLILNDLEGEPPWQAEEAPSGAAVSGLDPW